MKLKRRHILLAALTTGVGATGIHNYLRLLGKRKLEELAREKLSNTDLQNVLKKTFEADAKKINEGLAIQASVKLKPPKIPYDRRISKRLIQCSKLGTQQYLTGKVEPSFDGSIKSLPAYSSALNGYTQMASLKGLEDQQISETVEVDVPAKHSNHSTIQDPASQNLETTESAIQQTVSEAVKIKNIVPVFFGFVLTSKTGNIIIFRGTQRTIEWARNVFLVQEDYKGFPNSKIHSGFAEIYRGLAEQTRNIAKQLNPSVPCYISGHSLGASLAVLAAIDLALNVPKLKDQIRLYTYACPRVGNPAFAELHSQIVPNSYRIVNLADLIPISPPTMFRNNIFVNIGQDWSFLTNYGDIMPNHVVDTYSAAVNKEVETNSDRQFPSSGLT